MRLISAFSAFTSDTDKALWRLALPMIFSNITVPLLGLVDTAVIGHLDSPTYLAAWRSAPWPPASCLCCCCSCA